MTTPAVLYDHIPIKDDDDSDNDSCAKPHNCFPIHESKILEACSSAPTSTDEEDNPNHDFDNSELRQFLTVSKWLKVPKGTTIIKENTTEKAFYILVKGEAEVCKTAGKKKKTVTLTL